MDFGQAVRLLKIGKRVHRTGWNGKGMFLFLVPGSQFNVNRPPLLGIYPEGTRIDYRAHIDMKTADGSVVPWVASQSDILAEDWGVVHDTQHKSPHEPDEPLRVFKDGQEIDALTGEPIEVGGFDIDRDGPPPFSS